MTILEKVAYLRGLSEGLGIDETSKEGRVFKAIIDVLDDISLTVTDLEDDVAELSDGLDEIDEDLGALEEEFYGDECDVELSIVDLDGDKKLKVHALREDASKDYGVVKLVFNLPEMLGVENVGNIGHISVDFTCIANETWKNDDGSESLVVGNFLGALAGNIASEQGKDADGNVIQNTWANHYEFAYQDWEHEEGSWRCETDIPALLPANGYAANDEGTTLVIMRWGQANDVDFYIDNLTFYDKDGNSMPVKASAAAEGGEAAPAEAESSEAAEESSEAPAETSEEA